MKKLGLTGVEVAIYLLIVIAAAYMIAQGIRGLGNV